MTSTRSQSTSVAKLPRFSIDKTHDCLGYVDKDVEVSYTDSDALAANTIASVNIYDDEWEED